MSAPENIFISKNRKSQNTEAWVFWLFRLAAYFVIACAAFIFLKIAVEGSKTVFTTEAPFINYKFFTTPPQTLHVHEPQNVVQQQNTISIEITDLKNQVSSLAQSDPTQVATIKNKIATLEEQYQTLDDQRKEERLQYSDDEYRALTEKPSSDTYTHKTYAYSGGGILPAIVGTILLVTGSVVIAIILGLFCAIFLSEYGKPGKILRFIRLSVINLAGVPSIVFGLFGFGLFVITLNWGVSLLAGWFTLAFMALPIIITSCEESLRAIPQGFREGSLALGATKWTSIRTNVLPYALPGILTSSIMGIAKVAGETAPIMFTAAFALRDQLPWEGLEKFSDFFFNGVMALPYHIYVVSAKIPQNEYTERMQYGSAFIFLLLVCLFALGSVFLRIRLRKKYQW